MGKAAQLPKTTRGKPKAAEQLQDLHRRLMEDSPGFAEADRMENAAEALCRAVRTELKDRRDAARLGQADLGAMVNLSQSAISKIESGAGDLSLKTIFRIAHALKLQPLVIFAVSEAAIAAAATLPAAKGAGKAKTPPPPAAPPPRPIDIQDFMQGVSLLLDKARMSGASPQLP